MDSLDEFFAEVRSSCTEHAKRKGYTDGGADDQDKLGPILASIGVTVDHGIGEIIAKLVEYRNTPRRLLLVKAAGWCWVMWRRTKE